MTGSLPTHVALADEPIPEPGTRLPSDGPDMRGVASIEEMLASLRFFEDDAVAYAAVFRDHYAAIGGSLLVHYDKDGDGGLMVGMPCDPQVRHRNRWSHFLIKDLDRVDGRRQALLDHLIGAGMCFRERRRSQVPIEVTP